MSAKQKKNLIRIIIAAVLTVTLIIIKKQFNINPVILFVMYLAVYLIIGYDIVIKAFKGIIHFQPFDECLLMSVATIGAFALAFFEKSGDYGEAVAVMLFYQIGEWFQSYAVGKSRKSISSLMDICPDYANIENEDGTLEQVDPDDVEPGTVITVKPGEKIPIDGVVVSGESTVDTSALTGESVPRGIHAGEDALSGTVNLTGVLKIRTTREFGESTASKVLELIEDASSNKSQPENFITKFARVYTPAVVISAVALAVLPPLIGMLTAGGGEWGKWIHRALTFLVISCPCALVISIPLSFFAGLGGASRAGILIKGSNYLEILSKTKTVLFDKTGTLTKGVFDVTAIHSDRFDPERLLHIAAHVERYSDHPVSLSLKRAYPGEADDCRVENVREIPGMGITADVTLSDDNKTLSMAVGNEKLMNSVGAACRKCHLEGTVIHIAVDGEYAGHIVISDVIKPGSASAIAELKKAGIEPVMLTGDSEAVAKSVAGELGIDNYRSGLLPQDKVEITAGMIDKKESAGHTVAFAGDGINDAPVLARADIGIAMGALGSDAAIEAADVVLMDDNPLKISKAVSIAKRCMRIVGENIVFSIAIKLICLVLGSVGIAGMRAAVFADVGVMIIAVLNAMRCMAVPEK